MGDLLYDRHMLVIIVSEQLKRYSLSAKDIVYDNLENFKSYEQTYWRHEYWKIFASTLYMYIKCHTI